MARYTRVKCRLWHDEKLRSLSEDGRMCFIYVLTSPHGNMLGMYVLAHGYGAADLKWDVKRFGKAFTELFQEHLIEYDESTNLVFIRNYIEHNPIENPNQVTAALKVLDELPTSPLFALLNEALEQLGKRFTEPLREQLAKRYAKPVTVSVTVSVTETVTKEMKERDEKRAFAPSVHMTQEEYDKLIDRFGEQSTADRIERLSLYKQSKGKKYKCDYSTILNWARKDSDKPMTIQEKNRLLLQEEMRNG